MDSFLEIAPQFLTLLVDSSLAKASLFPTLLAVGRIHSNCLKQCYKEYKKKKNREFLIEILKASKNDSSIQLKNYLARNNGDL